MKKLEKNPMMIIDKTGKQRYKLRIDHVQHYNTDFLENLDIDHIILEDIFNTEIHEESVIHTHKVSVKEIECIINSDEYSRELLHILKNDEGYINLDEVVWEVYGSKTLFKIDLREFVALRNRVLTELRERKAHQYRNARVYKCNVNSSTIPTSNLFDDIFKIIENM